MREKEEIMDTSGNETLNGQLTLNGNQAPLPAGHRALENPISGMETMGKGDSPVLAGRYKVVRRLGEGGMGSVWLAEDTKLDNRQVAIKMLPAVLAGKKGAYRQVKQEALMAMKLSHPNIATVRAFEEDEGGSPFLVMDYIEGTGLDDHLAEKGALGEAETLKLLGPVAAALDYAHDKGVVHRDVKPGNVIVDKTGTPYVLDFGIAREIQETMTRVTGKFSSGTLLYMSPEQLNGRAPKAAQDVYSFAAMAYECLTGAPPFSRGQIEWQIVNNPPEPLPEEAAGEALRQGVMAGLSKEPEKRPGTCTGVLGRGSADKRNGENHEAKEAHRKWEEEAFRVWERARAEEEQRRRQEQAERLERRRKEQAERLARERARAEYAQRQKEEELEAERKARKEAEAEARGRAVGWAWFLGIVLMVGGLLAYGLWQQEHEASQGRRYTGRTPVETKGRGATDAAVARDERPEGERSSRAGERTTIRVGSREVALRWCPADTFTMGSPDGEAGRNTDETQHRVTLTRGFWLGETEVTQGLWREVMGENPS